MQVQDVSSRMPAQPHVAAAPPPPPPPPPEQAPPPPPAQEQAQPTDTGRAVDVKA